MLVQPDELGSTSEEHDGAAALKTANTSFYRLKVTWTPETFCYLCVCLDSG